MYAYPHATFSRWAWATCSTTFPFYPYTVGCTYSDFAVQGLRAWPFSLSGKKQKELCSWIWVWVRGSMCVYIGAWWCVACGWTTNCCTERYATYIKCVSEARGRCQRCLSVTVKQRWRAHGWEQQKKKKEGNSVPYGRVMTKRDFVCFRFRQTSSVVFV